MTKKNRKCSLCNGRGFIYTPNCAEGECKLEQKICPKCDGAGTL